MASCYRQACGPWPDTTHLVCGRGWHALQLIHEQAQRVLQHHCLSLTPRPCQAAALRRCVLLQQGPQARHVHCHAGHQRAHGHIRCRCGSRLVLWLAARPLGRRQRRRGGSGIPVGGPARRGWADTHRASANRDSVAPSLHVSSTGGEGHAGFSAHRFIPAGDSLQAISIVSIARTLGFRTPGASCKGRAVSTRRCVAQWPL